MIAVIQRVSQASVLINNYEKGHIKTGFLILLGIGHTDSQEDIDWLSRKIVGMRIFSDDQGKMNLDLAAVGGDILLISQFTLHASTKKGIVPALSKPPGPKLLFLCMKP